MADIITSEAVPVVRLTEVFRQAAESRIIVNAHRINQGLMPDLARAESGDFHFVDATDPEDGARKVLTVVRERIPKRFGFDPIRDIQVLCPMNRGGLGARSLNIELQKTLNPPGDIRIERFGWTFCPGDKVMQVENDYDKDVYNGDLGTVSTIDMEESELVADFDGRKVSYGFGELDELVLAYATTIHKSQGSEYPAIVIPLTTQHYPMLQRNLVYNRCDARQTARRADRATEGAGDRHQGSADTTAVVETAGVADRQHYPTHEADRELTDIYVDGDACPVREEIYRVAARLGLKVFVVSNGSRPIRPPGTSNVSMVLVSDAADAADDWIAGHITSVDLCVTSDIPLASRCLKRGARVVSPTGTHWTQANIGNALAGREIARYLRELGENTRGPAPLTKRDRSRFLSALDTAIQAALREAP